MIDPARRSHESQQIEGNKSDKKSDKPKPKGLLIQSFIQFKSKNLGKPKSGAGKNSKKGYSDDHGMKMGNQE